MPSRYIRVHERDNVAIIVDPEGAPAGTEFPGGLILREHIPQEHKVALHQLNPGEPVIRTARIFRFILDVASGRKRTWADHWGLHNALAPFNPGPIT